MKKLITRYITLVSSIAILLSAISTTSLAATTLTIGTIGSNPQKEIKTFTPLMNYLEQKLGITSQILVFENSNQLAEAIIGGSVDFFMDSPFPSAKVSQKSGARFVLRHWKKGVSEYSGVIFTRADGVDSLNDLKGKLIAFEDPDSTSSYLLPLLLLKEANIPLSKKSSFRDKAASNEVGYVFSGDDENSMLWVSKKRVAAGGIKKLEVEGEDKYKILAESPMVPRAVVCFAPHLTGKLATSLEAAFVGMKSDPAAKDALAAIKKTTQFDMFPQGANTVQKNMIKYVETLSY